MVNAIKCDSIFSQTLERDIMVLISETNKNKERLILAVDDNPSNLSIIKTVLQKAGYTSLTAMSGKEAISLAETAQPDLILLDIKMPDMDGFEACRQLKSRESTANIPIMFLTADTEIKSMAKGFEIGAVDYITKPFNSVELRTRLKTHLDIIEKNEIIDKKSHEQKELLHVLCHDLSNPLGNLQTILEMYDEDPGLFDELLEPMKISVRNGLELIDLVRQLRAFEEKGQPLEIAKENLQSLLNEALSIIKPKLSKKNLTLETSINKDHFVAVEKTSLINSVLNNLLTNAIKFSYSGSKIAVKSEKQGELIQLSVRDFGIGMSAKMIDDVFDISKTTSRPGTEEEKGTGFGMPLVKKFMFAYRGDINIISTEKTDTSKHHGTEVILSFRSV